MLAQQAQHVIATTIPPNGYVPYQPYQNQQQVYPNRPFESTGNDPIPPYNNATQPYMNPARYTQQFPTQPLQQKQDYKKQPPPKQAPQE